VCGCVCDVCLYVFWFGFSLVFDFYVSMILCVFCVFLIECIPVCVPMCVSWFLFVCV